MRLSIGMLAVALGLVFGREASGNENFVFDDPGTVLTVPGGWLKTTTGSKDSVLYWGGTNALGQTLELRHRQAASGTTDEAFMVLLSGLDEELVGFSIEMRHSTADQLLEFVAQKGDEQFLFVVYRSLRGASLWKVEGLESEKQAVSYGEKIRLHAGEEQYTLALREGNINMGAWAQSIHAYAQLLAERKDLKAEKVYRNLLQRNASNYQAHLEFSRLATDESLRTECLRIILRDAEDTELLKEASGLLGLSSPTWDDYPVLSEKDEGFRVVLIPLPPCNLWMLEEVAKTYESMTTIPVCIRRLPEAWTFPDQKRSVYRRDLEKIAFSLLPDNPNVKAWSQADLQKTLMKAAKEKDPESVPYLEALFKRIEEGEFQWDASPLVATLNKRVQKVLPSNKYTMVVGITGNDIYGDNTRYLFSLHGGGRAPLSVLSYSRMKAYPGENPSRKRLAERCAKELVPASLKSLYIPRSIDPSCPYSYANGIQRLDEKTKTLSPVLVAEIERIRKEANAE